MTNGPTILWRIPRAFKRVTIETVRNEMKEIAHPSLALVTKYRIRNYICFIEKTNHLDERYFLERGLKSSAIVLEEIVFFSYFLVVVFSANLRLRETLRKTRAAIKTERLYEDAECGRD